MITKLKYLLKFSLVKVKKKNIFNANGKIKNTQIRIKGENNEFNLCDNGKIRDSNIYVGGKNNKIYFGKNVDIRNLKVGIYTDGQEIYIGENTSIGGGKIFMDRLPAKIKIGKECMLSYNVEIRTTDSHPIYSINTKELLNPEEDILIENNVWVGANSTILKGSILEEGSILGSGSVLKGKVDKNCVAVGVPAKVIKREIEWKIK
jgi:acetyltransferase-like isoleucine patch superfamily enzyme